MAARGRDRPATPRQNNRDFLSLRSWRSNGGRYPSPRDRGTSRLPKRRLPSARMGGADRTGYCFGVV